MAHNTCLSHCGFSSSAEHHSDKLWISLNQDSLARVENVFKWKPAAAGAICKVIIGHSYRLSYLDEIENRCDDCLET
jgi:hypothetical protein